MTSTTSTSRPQYSTLNAILAGGVMFATVGFFMDIRQMMPRSQESMTYEGCAGETQENVTLSREQLARFLTIAERDSKSRVREILAHPYCQLSTIQIRQGIDAEREAYPLAFDPKTWLVILYEGDEYAGYRFSFQ